MNTLTHTPILDSCSKEDLLNYFQNSWELEETLLRSITEEETFYINPDPLRNRLIFYLGHSAVFYINKLIRVGLLNQGINDYYETLFEIGVDPESAEELDKAVKGINWPDVEKVWQYREQAKAEITKVINQAEISLPIKQNSPLWALLMAIEHSLIHFETSSMLMRQLSPDKLQRPPEWNYSTSIGKPPNNELREIPGGIVNLGKSPDSSTYSWDIDYGKLTVVVKPFLASKYLISNQEFLEFVRDNGYDNPEFWDTESWQWRQTFNVQHPKFWIRINNSYKYRTVFEEIDLPLDFPVEVNHYEAMAYCRWRGEGTRLLTEAEWKLVVEASETKVQEGNFSTKNYNLNLKYFSPSTVGMADQSNNKFGLCDVRGNVWQWLGDKFNCLPGFKAHYLYKDYSEPFFDNKHYLIVGGCWSSMGAYASAFCRNWFRPYFYQHVGFRIARDIK
ncbi:MAG: 5-histidylcysteine sulfoxide synthase [Xenococcus sp. (in: cyanobacteria)]